VIIPKPIEIKMVSPVSNDLVDEKPEMVNELARLYTQYEKENGVIPVPDDYDPLSQLAKNSKSGRAGH
jgi:hypothetical protein